MTEKNSPAEARASFLSQKLGAYFKDSRVVEVVDTNDLVKKSTDGNVNIMMGQTFDDGQPVDILKYALFIMDVQDILHSGGVSSSSTWLIADHFISDINKDEEKAEVERQAKERISFLKAINAVYVGKIDTQLSSQLSETRVYQNNLSRLTSEADRNPEFKSQALLAVPEDRRSDPNSLIYPFEEIATIETMSADIKVGPVYERKYDEPARDIAPRVGFKSYVPINLTRGFLFGAPDVQPKLSEEIEEFGILPYKKSSKKLGEFRLDPINDSPDRTRKLIYETTDARALIDLLAIAGLAKARIEGNWLVAENQEDAKTDINELRKLAYDAYIWYIYNPLQMYLNN